MLKNLKNTWIRKKKKVILVIAHSILIAIHMIKEDKEYEDLEADFYNKFNKEKKQMYIWKN